MSGQTYQHILAAIDLGNDDDQVLNKAIAIAQTHSAKLSVIHVDVDPVKHMWAPGLIHFKKMHEEPKA